jgi:hypothetical protein
MTQRLTASACLLAAALAIGAAPAMAADPGGFQVSKAQQDMVRAGMSTDEVRKAIGQPSRIYNYRNEPGPTWTYNVIGENCATVYEVDFGPDGKVIKAKQREIWTSQPRYTD